MSVWEMRTYEEAGPNPGGGNPSRIHAKSLTRDLKKKTNRRGAWAGAIEMEMLIVPIDGSAASAADSRPITPLITIGREF